MLFPEALRLGRPLRFCAALVLVLAFGGAAWGADFPPITDAERKLNAVQGVPNAPGVILFRNGEFQMRDFSKGDPSSRLTIRGRIKVLSEEGKSLGEITIPYSGTVRLSGFEGRTVLPDGTAVPLPADAKFQRRLSKSRKLYQQAVAFPAVQVGAILDYKYDLYFDSIFLLEPWYFADELTTLHSEITYFIPKSMAVQTWRRDPYQIGIQLESSKTVQAGLRVKAWADRLPPLPDEPFQAPFEELAAQIVMLPTRWTDDFETTVLMESWATTSGLLLEYYDAALRKEGDADKKAKELTAGAKGQREQAEALYRFVRDRIETDDFENVILTDGNNPGETLKKGRGDSVDKSLLLIALLKELKIKARPVWAAERQRGLIDPGLANPAWFHETLVAAEIDGARVYLDPTDRALGFGQLPAFYEGTIALLPDRKKPEPIVLPESPWEQSRRKATVKLEVDDQGVAKGTGTFLLSGHHATAKIHWQESAEKTVDAWKEWLQDRQKDFAISDVTVAESPEARTVEVKWTMRQREEEALGDELTLAASRPLGPVAQPFTLASAKRRSPILFDFPDRDEVELELRWPAGWKVEAVPKAATFEGGGVAFRTEIDVQAEARTLSYKRRMEIQKKQFASREEVEAVRSLFEAAAKSDVEALVLARK